jgi:type I restriction enzyme R subunit
MSTVGQRERATQNRVINLLQNQLGYTYLGNWEYRPNNRNIEPELLQSWLHRQGHSETLINKTLRALEQAAALGDGKNLYEVNKDVYELLRYGVKVREDVGENKQTVWLIDWRNPLNNHFGFAEEVSVRGENKKRPDIVLYVNGIALGVLELKRGTVSVAEGIRQNLDNQKSVFIRQFFHTMQLVLAGNDTEGLRYGTIETPEKYYLKWKEADRSEYGHLLDWDLVRQYDALDLPLDKHLVQVCDKKRFLEIIYDFTLFDGGIKKVCRPHQYFGVKASQQRIRERKGGIIWHSQGSGKSLTMVWLAKWIRENVTIPGAHHHRPRPNWTSRSYACSTTPEKQ